jgi:hypothetical protein
MVRTGDKDTQFGVPVRGRGAETRPASGRVCDEPGCGTILSTYNKAPTCWKHATRALRHPLYRSASEN